MQNYPKVIKNIWIIRMIKSVAHVAIKSTEHKVQETFQGSEYFKEKREGAL
jgi:hypothetical protein